MVPDNIQAVELYRHYHDLEASFHHQHYASQQLELGKMRETADKESRLNHDLPAGPTPLSVFFAILFFVCRLQRSVSTFQGHTQYFYAQPASV
jgi:hypothetical protein